MFEGLIPLLMFIAVFLCAWNLQRLIRARRLQHQVVALGTAADRQAVGPRPPAWKKLFFNLLPLLGAWQARWLPETWRLRVEKRLAYIPPWQGRTASEWLAAKELAAVAGLGAGWLLAGDAWWAALLALGAFFLPELWLREQNQKRRRGILRELPNLLDLLAACMEAGLGFEQALLTILERDQRGYLKTELTEMMRAIRMGESRRDALLEMAQRVEEQDFTTFTTALMQAEKLGVSISHTLQTQAVQLRSKRSQQVEKLALEAPVKLLFPLIVFIFPVVFLVLFGPLVIRFIQGF